MKKIAFIFCLLFLSAAAFADAQKKITGFDVSVPLETRTWHLSDNGEDSGNASTVFAGFNINLYRMTVESDGLSFIYSAGAGKGKLQLEKNMKMDCYDLNARFGAGHAFLNSDDMVFALHVFAGIGVKYARGPQSGIDIEALEYRMPFGADASFVMKLSERFSLCAGFDLSVNFLGFGSFMIETGDGSSSKGYTIDYLFSGLNAVPHLGFCWLL